VEGHKAEEVQRVATALLEKNPQVPLAGSVAKEHQKAVQRRVAFTFGVVFIVVLLVLALFVPEPSPFQYTVFRIVLALAAAGAAAMIPGFIEFNIPGWLRAGGALAVFIVVFFYNPASLVAPPTPHVNQSTFSERSRGRALLAGYDGAFAVAHALQGHDLQQERARLSDYLRQLGVTGAEFPLDPLGPARDAEPAAKFAQSVLGTLEARDPRLGQAFVLGWFGVISLNTPNLKPPDFELRKVAGDAGFRNAPGLSDLQFLEALVAEARRDGGA
jgi:hypothetical protein